VTKAIATGNETRRFGGINIADRIERPVSSEDARRASSFVALLLGCFYLLLLCQFRASDYFLRDPDTYWHIAVGRRIWETGSFPWVDEFSHTFQGQPWIAKEWLSQLIMFASYSLGGWRCVVLATAVAIAATYVLLFAVLSRQMRLTVAAGIATAAYAFSTGHFVARPQIFADPLIVIWVAALVKAVDVKAPPSPWLLPVMTLWANLHGSFTFGLALAAALGIEAVCDSSPGSRRPTAARWALFLIASFACTCLTPYGLRSMLVTYQLFGGNEALNYVTEWRPVTLGAFGLQESIIFALLFLALYFGIRLRFWRLLTILAAAYLMFAHIRFAALFAILTPLLVMTPLTDQHPYLRLTSQVAADPGFFAALLKASRALGLPLSVLLAAGISLFGAFGPSMIPKADITPRGAVDYIRERQLAGNIYNFYNFGGYLIFSSIKTFIDGRSDQLFQHGFMTSLYDAVEHNPNEFIRLLKRYRVSVALVTPDSAEARKLDTQRDWSKTYFDDVSVVYETSRQD
jgi:hypothetical protein